MSYRRIPRFIFDERVVFGGRLALDGIDARAMPNVCSATAI
jgi:hypothetical protein